MQKEEKKGFFLDIKSKCSCGVYSAELYQNSYKMHLVLQKIAFQARVHESTNMAIFFLFA